MHEHEVPIDADVVRSLLVDQFPDLSDLPLEAHPTRGTQNAVFRLGPDLAVRLPRHQDAVCGLVKEIRWLPTLRPLLHLEVPEVRATGVATSEYPFQWAVVRWLEGADAVAAPLDSLVQAAETLARFCIDLWSVDPADVPPTDTAGFHRGRHLAHRDEAFRAAIRQCAGLADVTALTRVWDEALAAPHWTGPPRWVHTDLIPPNLLVHEGRLTGVLDFGELATGDPAWDLTPAWFVLDGPSRKSFRSLLEAEVDDAAWVRARGAVVSQAVIALPYYLDTNPTMVQVACRGIDALLGVDADL
ncbi:aminoglycoside phosphotransferase family protein [Intrasporangium sp.]|uniref:aminoglycoside phosphotransferase family protein n=1 Tax=Intrasporangium sp. TaxID=1925024 RepID=UPI0032218F78